MHHIATIVHQKMKGLLLVIIAITSCVATNVELRKRQSEVPNITTTTVPPSLCVGRGPGSGCYPITQCISSTFSPTEGVYYINPNSEVCGWNSVTKEIYVCCIRKPDINATTLTTTSTTAQPPAECAVIQTPGFGVIWRKALFNRANSKPFIVGGQNAGKDIYPYMAALFYKDIVNKTRPFCGASIISRKSLLTAAHCFLYMDPIEKFVAVIGDYILGNSLDAANPIEVDVERIILHPGYNGNDVYNDIAILILANPLTFSKGIAPICLPGKELVKETFATLPSVVTGWGQDAFGGRYKTTLQSAVIPVVPQQECQKIYSTLSGADETLPNGITADLLCAGLYNDTRKDACQGDSGGPLAAAGPDGIHWIQIGIVASGFQCGQVYPGLYTRVTPYLDWIQANKVE